jgi:hypothetical protein
MLFDRQKFVLAVHQALKEHDKEKDTAVDSGGHHVTIDCDRELEHLAYRILVVDPIFWTKKDPFLR